MPIAFIRYKVNPVLCYEFLFEQFIIKEYVSDFLVIEILFWFFLLFDIFVTGKHLLIPVAIVDIY